MTRSKWTTKDQELWLEERKPAFLVANQKKSAAKEYFPLVTKEFRDKWPVPPVTEDEIKDAGSLDMAIRVKKNRYDKVSQYNGQWIGRETYRYIAYMLLVS
jgi:hypothetical protein